MTVELPAGVPGIDVPRLAAWLSGALPDAGRISNIELIAGGRSNLTYRLDLAPTAGAGAAGDGVGGGRVVVRRPPLGHVLPTAHDMVREHRVLSALADSAVPVPRPLALCADEDVIGAPFYVMEYVEGRVLRTVEDAADVQADQAGALSEQLVDVMAAIHLLDVEAAGLADFGRPAGYLARQLRRWGKQWEASHAAHLQAVQAAAGAGTASDGTAAGGRASDRGVSTGAASDGAAGDGVPADYERLFARLAERLPEHPPAAPAGRSGDGGLVGTLVHGDFRLDNALVRLAPKPAIAAVVDWEMSTLGDPLADLGLTLVYWTESDDDERLAIPVGSTVTAAPGFGTGRDFAERYAGRTGFDLTDLDFYVAFGCFKLAVVLEGIHARFLQNATVGEGFDQVGESVPILVERAHRILDARSPWPEKR